MSLVHRCDMCKKITLSEAYMFVSGRSYTFSTKQKLNKQKIVLNLGFHLECGEDAELCDSCAWKIIKKAIN